MRVTQLPRRFQGSGCSSEDADKPASAFTADLGSRKNGPAAQEHQPGTELKDTGRNCDERHMMVSENLKRPEHQSTMNNVYKHL